MNKLTDIAKGIIVGILASAVIFGSIITFWFLRNRDREVVEHVERQIEVQALREDYINRDPDEFMEIPDVRRAADGATAEFDRKRDEAVQRLRNRPVD